MLLFQVRLDCANSVLHWEEVVHLSGSTLYAIRPVQGVDFTALISKMDTQAEVEGQGRYKRSV